MSRPTEKRGYTMEQADRFAKCGGSFRWPMPIPGLEHEKDKSASCPSCGKRYCVLCAVEDGHQRGMRTLTCANCGHETRFV